MLTDLVVELLFELHRCFSFRCFSLGDPRCQLSEAGRIEVGVGLLFRASEET